MGRFVVAVLLACAAIWPASAGAADIRALGAQQRLTQMGPDGDIAFFARDPAIAYNSLADEFLLVWVGRDTALPTEPEVYGRILDGAGKPKGAVRRLSFVPGATAPGQPVVGYSPNVNQYLLAYTGPPPAGPNNPSGQIEVLAQAVTAVGAPSGNPVRISNTDPDNADADVVSDPAIAYDHERDQFRLVWRADHIVEGDFEIFTRRVSSTLIDPDNFSAVQVSATAAGDADEPAIAFLPNQDRYVVVWEAASAGGGTEIAAKVLTAGGGTAVSSAEISVAAGAASAVQPSIAANPDDDEVLVSFIKNDVAGEGPEVFVQRLTAGGVQVPSSADTRISTIGPPGNAAYGASVSRATTTTYHPQLDRYLVTWAADDDLPGLVDNEFERYGQALTAAGAEVAADDFRISTAGPDGTAATIAEDGATAALPGRRSWLHVWEADDNRPPLADGEHEAYGRLAGDDGDLDGFAPPQDCNDANPGIRPGAADVPDNGIDEDCSGADTVTPPPPAPLPGPAPTPAPPGRTVLPTLTSGVASSWHVKGAAFRLLELRVTQRFPRGWKATIKCSGKRCPFKSRRLKAGKVRRGSSNVITALKAKQRRFRARQTIEVWVTAPGFNTKVARLVLRKGRIPTTQALCAIPGEKKPRRRCD